MAKPTRQSVAIFDYMNILCEASEFRAAMRPRSIAESGKPGDETTAFHWKRAFLNLLVMCDAPGSFRYELWEDGCRSTDVQRDAVDARGINRRGLDVACIRNLFGRLFGSHQGPL